MSQSFEDRVEDVLGELHGMAWPLLEEPQKKKIVGKVARGIDKGDTIAAWARALGVPPRTIGQRVDRFRSSEPIDGPDPASVARKARYMKQGFKEVVRDPKLGPELVTDPGVRRALYELLDQTEKEPVSRPSGATRRPTSSEARNISALARLSDMHASAEQANELVHHDRLTEHQTANAEVLLRATESEIAVWRENTGGGLTDEAIAALTEGR